MSRCASRSIVARFSSSAPATPLPASSRSALKDAWFRHRNRRSRTAADLAPKNRAASGTVGVTWPSARASGVRTSSKLFVSGSAGDRDAGGVACGTAALVREVVGSSGHVARNYQAFARAAPRNSGTALAVESDECFCEPARSC